MSPEQRQMTRRSPQRGASAVPAVSSPQSVEALLMSKSTQIQDLLGDSFDLRRWVRIAIKAAQRNPKILQSDPMSLVGALMDCAQMRLEPSGRWGAHLVPYWNSKTNRYEVQTIVDYRGLLSLVRRSKQIVDISVRVVRQGDKFKERAGSKPELVHEILDRDGPMVLVYAVARLSTGGEQYEVMTAAQVDAIRDRSRAKDGGPWVTDYEQMAKKTVLRRLCNTLPIEEPEVQEAIRAADREFEEYDSSASPGKSVALNLDSTIQRARESIEALAPAEPEPQETLRTEAPEEPTKHPQDRLHAQHTRASPPASNPARPPRAPTTPPQTVQGELLTDPMDSLRAQCVDLINSYNDHRGEGTPVAKLPPEFGTMAQDQLQALREMLYTRLEMVQPQT